MKNKRLFTIITMLILTANFMIFAESSNLSVNGAITISKDNPVSRYLYDDKTQEEIVSAVEDIELPLRQKGYGKYYDDFDRRVANEIRKDAKTMYLEQEKAKEISLKDAVMPLSKVSNLYSDNYYGRSYSYCLPADSFSSESSKYNVAFYDALGRKISDEFAVDANKLYEKQRRRNEVSCWASASVHDIWRYIWGTVKLIIILMILFFVAALFYKKVIKKA